MYSLKIADLAEKDLDLLSKDIWAVVKNSIKQLATNPKPQGYAEVGDDVYRLNVETPTTYHRVLYNVDEDKKTITILRVMEYDLTGLEAFTGLGTMQQVIAHEHRTTQNALNQIGTSKFNETMRHVITQEQETMKEALSQVGIGISKFSEVIQLMVTQEQEAMQNALAQIGVGTSKIYETMGEVLSQIGISKLSEATQLMVAQEQEVLQNALNQMEMASKLGEVMRQAVLQQQDAMREALKQIGTSKLNEAMQRMVAYEAYREALSRIETPRLSEVMQEMMVQEQEEMQRALSVYTISELAQQAIVQMSKQQELSSEKNKQLPDVGETGVAN